MPPQPLPLIDTNGSVRAASAVTAVRAFMPLPPGSGVDWRDAESVWRGSPFELRGER